jgi:hypothetical protein
MSLVSGRRATRCARSTGDPMTTAVQASAGLAIGGFR